jgi:hypothetical protein
MKKVIIIILLSPIFCTAQQKNHWIDNYWFSTNLSLLHSIEKRGAGISFDVGRNINNICKAGLGYTFIQFDLNTQVDVVNVYLEKSIDAKRNALFFFAKPGIAIPKKAMVLADKISPYEYEGKKSGFNIQLGSGIRWKVKRHSFFLSAGYNKTNFSFTAIQFVQPVNPYNPFIDDPINHTYKLSYSNIIVNLGFTL